MQGIRLPLDPDGHIVDWPSAPGEYVGPVYGYTGDKPAVFFLKPNAHDPDAPRIAHAVHHVTAPPHTFTEEPDGTLTIQTSIGDMHDGVSDGWHGYLTRGKWLLA